MSINQRKHTRFSLDLPAVVYYKNGEIRETVLQQISIGGCFTDWEDEMYVGEEFRLEVELPNKNKLPLRCKALYRFENAGIGVKFIDISQFEQQLISHIIESKLADEGVPLYINPFDLPSTYIEDDPSPKITDRRRQKEEILERIMSGDE